MPVPPESRLNESQPLTGLRVVLSREVRAIRQQAQSIARATAKPANSVHYLIGTLLVECLARDLLWEAGIDEARALDTYERLDDAADREDGAEVLAEVHRLADGLAESAGAKEVTSTVLLASLLRVRHAVASQVLDAAGVNVPGLRAKLIGQVTMATDRAGMTGTRQAARGTDPAIALPPSTASLTGVRRLPLPMQGPLDHLMRERTGERQLPLRTPEPQRSEPPRPPETQRPSEPVARSLEPTRGPEPARPFDTPRHIEPVPAHLHAPDPARADGPSTSPSPRPVPAPPRTSPRPLHPQVFELDPKQFPTLVEVGRNLTHAALAGEIDAIFGRDTVIDAVIDVLLMRQVNNPCLIGEAGVGKTAVVEGLALKLAGNVGQYGRLGSAVIVEIQTSSLLAGTALRGAFSERMRKLREEVARAEGQVIIFMDEIHTIMGAGTGDGPLDAANDLKSALSRGKFPLIGATTRTEYERHIEKDPAMERRFQTVDVAEPSVPEAIAILSGVAPTYAKHHQVLYSPDAIQSAVHLSKRFITDRCLPDKAIAVLDRAGAQTRRAGRPTVQVDDVARAVHQLTAVPMDRLMADERGRIRDLAADLQALVVGHDAAMAKVAKRIQRNYAGFSGDRPLASLLFVGAPGVGKTETARALARSLFVAEDALVRFDMTEFQESHSVAKLVGSPPGYVGHGQAGQLAHALQKRPYRVLLFDEIDRAAPEVIALLLQLLDRGRLTDNQGQVVDVRNSIVVMTAGLGAELLVQGARRKVGFGHFDAAPPDEDNLDPRVEAAVVERAKSAFPPEFWTRLDETIVFRPLSAIAARAIVERHVRDGAQRLYDARLIRYHVDASVLDLLVEGGLDPAHGARQLRSRVESLVESHVTELILDGTLQPGMEATLTVREGRLMVAPVELAAGHGVHTTVPAGVRIPVQVDHVD